MFRFPLVNWLRLDGLDNVAIEPVLWQVYRLDCGAVMEVVITLGEGVLETGIKGSKGGGDFGRIDVIVRSDINSYSLFR